MLRLEWLREGRPAALIATGERGKGQRLEEEIGDILYELDPGIVVHRALPDTLVVYSRLEPLLLFRRLLHWPPAYASRIVPLMAHIPLASPEWVVSILFSRIYEKCLRGVVVSVEARVRGSSRASKHVQRVIIDTLRAKGIRVSRREARVSILVECIPGVACGVAILPPGCDRVGSWWESPRITSLCASFTC